MLGLRFRVLGSPLEADETGMRMWVGGSCAFCGFVRQTTKAEKENKRHTAQATKSDVPRKRTMEVAMAMAMRWRWRHACQQTEKMGGMGRGNSILGCQALAEKLASTIQIQIFGNKNKYFFLFKNHHFLTNLLCYYSILFIYVNLKQ